ncbi:MAG: glycosyltransferase family 39 protein [Thermoplasmatales archaeon]|nr:MAG: glycosyltransferase family 39 protein [Thermoplasmatales archaeon]
MRKRAQRRIRPTSEEPKYISKSSRPSIEKKQFKLKKNWWIAVALIGIFFLVLFLNTYFNLTSEVSINPEGEGFNKFYLSGPDPYYNLRLVKETYETGKYPFFYEPDPLLNYPLGAKGGRAPLFNMMALGFSRIMSPFIDEVEAIGYSMQFVPALYGALLVFVVYFLGKELFNKKAGLFGAFFIAIIPIHLGSGHGSAYGLFDHDSFNLLLFFLTFLFLIKAIKEKDATKSILYAILAGVPLAALSMTWVEAQYLYTIIAIYAIVQMLFDIFTNKIEFKVFRTISLILLTGFLISAPVISFKPDGFSPNTTFYICVFAILFGVVYYLFGKLKIPWTVSLPTIVVLGASGLGFIYFAKDLAQQFPFLSPLQRLSTVIFGTGIYGNKVSMTIAEAGTYQISQTVMSYGPALYWIGWGGLVYLIYHYYKNKIRREYLFIIILFITNIWLAGVAGRFLNDMVPVIVVLSGWIVWLFVEWLDYKQMLRNIKSAGGGLHGIRRGVKFLHIFGILFLALIVILPNVFVAFDAAVPNTPKQKEDGTWTSYKAYMYGDDNYRGAYGLGIIKEKYWQDAFEWLSEQDTNIDNPNQRPGFISWWDYGFYESALGEHPTVADNFQDGIPVAANFHTSITESEAVSVWIVRLLEGEKKHNNGKLTQATAQVLTNHLGQEDKAKVEQWILDPTTSPSYGDPIGEEYDEETSKEYTVGQQYPENAVYHDIVELFNETLDDEKITWLYHDLQESTGWSIRYYGVEGYDRQIFNIFSFLSDKSLLLINGIADDFVELLYEGYIIDPSTGQKRPGSETTWTADEVLNWDKDARKLNVVTNTQTRQKELYFETMFYKTYIGPAQGESPDLKEFDYQIPCVGMKHFYAEYFSDLSLYPYYDTGKAAVVIAKYYEGAFLNGTVTFMDDPVEATVVVQKNITYYGNVSAPIDHDRNTTSENGNFSLIAGAGTTLQILRSYPENIQPFAMKNLSFDGAEGSEFAPITDDDAMRKGDNYERFLNISIEPASLESIIYTDINDDGFYNKSVDTPIQDVYIELYDISNPEAPKTMTTNKDGYFKASNLMPGYYYVVAIKDGYTINEQLVELYENNNYYNISRLKNSSIEGKVFFEDESNPIGNAPILLIYQRMNIQGGVDEEFLVGSIDTDANGKYAFYDLVPGEYKLQVEKDLTYRSYEEITLGENETKYHNVSMELTPVRVFGSTIYKAEGLKEIGIFFKPDESVENNTAVESSISSDENGFFEVDIPPGSYNVEVDEKIGNILVYSFEGYLELQLGEGRRGYNISITKHSSNISGYTLLNGEKIDNVTKIRFIPDLSIENNSAIYGFTTESDETGYYSLELSPGYYNVSVEHEFIEDDKNYTYVFSSKFVVDVEPSIYKYDISVTKEAID